MSNELDFATVPMKIHPFSVMPIVELYGSTHPYEVYAELDSLELTGGLTEDDSASEADYDRLFFEGDPQNVSDFLWNQVLDAQEKLSDIFCWINLTPSMLARADVREKLSWLAHEPDARILTAPYKFAQNVGFEIVERGELDEFVKSVIKYLRFAEYLIAFDDLGSGNFADSGVVKRLAEELGPDKLKFDTRFVKGNNLDVANGEVEIGIFEWLDDWTPHAPLTLEGVSLQLGKKSADGRYAVVGDNAFDWARVCHNLRQNLTQRQVTVQLPPMSIADFKAL